jgi:uncharacterized protein YbaR (Trm112 family)
MPLCPECATQISVTEEVGVSKVFVCPGCQVPLEVTRREPVTLALVEMMQVPEHVEGDWGD